MLRNIILYAAIVQSKRKMCRDEELDQLQWKSKYVKGKRSCSPCASGAELGLLLERWWPVTVPVW
jgi:hypothetical protein